MKHYEKEIETIMYGRTCPSDCRYYLSRIGVQCWWYKRRTVRTVQQNYRYIKFYFGVYIGGVIIKIS